MLNSTAQHTDSFHVEASSTAEVRCVPRTDLNFSASQVEHSPLTLFSNIRRALLTLKTSLSHRGRGGLSQHTSLRAKRSNPRNNLILFRLPRRNSISPRNDIKRGGFFSPFTYRLLACQGFTIAEILIVLGIVGVIASLTIPNLIQSAQERQMVTGLQKFSSNLQQAVMLWKQDIGCDSPAVTCISQSNIIIDNTVSMDPLTKFMNVSKVIPFFNSGTANWLPAQTFDYYGNSQTGDWGGCSNASTSPAKYLLSDGTTFCADVNSTNFVITADVNGKKAPNRMGKDTFMFVIGFKAPRDIWPYACISNYASNNALGLCGVISTCDPTNTDPTVSNGASPTAYVLLNHRLPDFKALSQTVSGFRP